MVSRSTIRFGLFIAVVFYFCFRCAFEPFEYMEGDFRRDVMILLTLFFANRYYKKETMKEQKELNRVEQSISENGLIKHHAKEIIQNYGHDAFVNKQQKEIEDVVNEYIGLFNINLDGFTVADIVYEINKETTTNETESKHGI